MAPLYARIYHELRSQGRVLSQVDMIVAAVARSLGTKVLSTDRDFDVIAGIHVENWLV